jgi:hypothetical protein
MLESRFYCFGCGNGENYNYKIILKSFFFFWQETIEKFIIQFVIIVYYYYYYYFSNCSPRFSGQLTKGFGGLILILTGVCSGFNVKELFGGFWV